MKSQHHVLSLCSTKELENLEQKRSQHIAIETSCTHERRKDFRSIFTFKKKFFKFLFMIFFFFLLYTVRKRDILSSLLDRIPEERPQNGSTEMVCWQRSKTKRHQIVWGEGEEKWLECVNIQEVCLDCCTSLCCKFLI